MDKKHTYQDRMTPESRGYLPALVSDVTRDENGKVNILTYQVQAVHREYIRARDGSIRRWSPGRPWIGKRERRWVIRQRRIDRNSAKGVA